LAQAILVQAFWGQRQVLYPLRQRQAPSVPLAMARSAVLLCGASLACGLSGRGRQGWPMEPPPMVGKRGGYDGADQVVEIHMDAQGHETLSYSHNLELRSDQCKGMVWWVHPPKTGTSFAASVERCERAKGRSKELYQNLPVEASDEILKTMVGMFRDPEERLLSAYHWIHRVPSCCIEDWGWQSVVFTKTKHEITQGVPAPKALGRFQGCYTNMIAGGAGCMSEHKPTSEEMREALRRVGLFRFCGPDGGVDALHMPLQFHHRGQALRDQGATPQRAAHLRHLTHDLQHHRHA